MLESFVIMLREGIEAALVIGILLVVLKRTGRKDLAWVVYWGMGLAIVGSVAAALALNALLVNEEAYEGVLYWVSATFVLSMMWWMRRRAGGLQREIEHQVDRTVDAETRSKEIWGLGAFSFLMVFREGAETVLFLSAVQLTTDALLSFIGVIAGLVTAIVFAVMFVRGSLQVNLKRFFTVTGWVLGIFLVQLLVNGYHEFSEAGLLPATQQSMGIVGPVVRNNALFILAMVAIPLFVWLTDRVESVNEGAVTKAEHRLSVAKRRRSQLNRYGAVASACLVLVVVGIVYAHELVPKTVPPPIPVLRDGDEVVIPVKDLEDGTLQRLGFLSQGRMVRFLAMKTDDGKIRTALDACEICGSFGYVQEDANLLCLNCAAGINPLTLDVGGGCNPVPLASEVSEGQVRVAVSILERASSMFDEQPALVQIDPVCGMRVKMNEAATFETYADKTYYFCEMDRCAAAFKKDPAAYVE